MYVNFEAYNNYVTESVYQWDINQTLNITGLSLASAPEVHFANANMERAIVRQSVINKGTISVTIPNSILQEPLPIKAYVGIYEGETFKIIESIKIPVIPKARPTDYVFIDDGGDIYSYNEILNKMISFENKYGDIDFSALKDYDAFVERVENTYTKNETLSNEVKSSFGLGNSAVPSDVFNALKNRIQVKTYQGNGSGGSSNPTTVSFDIKPIFFIIYGKVDNSQNLYYSVTVPWGANKINYTPYDQQATPRNDNGALTFTYGEKEVSFYTDTVTDNKNYQFNLTGEQYTVIAVG